MPPTFTQYLPGSVSKYVAHLVGLEHKVHHVSLGFLVPSPHCLQYQFVANKVSRVSQPLPRAKPAAGVMTSVMDLKCQIGLQYLSPS